jgi:large subunit ribosomal protein L22
MPGAKTNERPGTRAVLRHSGMSATKARQVLDLIRGLPADRAAEMLATTDREAARVIGKVLASAVANAVHNDFQSADELYVSACYADEGATLKRWRPRARGRATRIRKRTTHITVIVSRMSDEQIARRQAARNVATAQRSRRVAGSRRRRAAEAASGAPAAPVEETATDVTEAEVEATGAVEAEAVEVDITAADEAEAEAEEGSGDAVAEDGAAEVTGEETGGEAAEEKGE